MTRDNTVKNIPGFSALAGKVVKKAWMLSGRRLRVLFESDDMFEVSPVAELAGHLLMDIKIGTIHPDADLAELDARPNALNPLTRHLVGQRFCGMDTRNGIFLLKFDLEHVVLDTQNCSLVPAGTPIALIKAALRLSARESLLEDDALGHPSTPPGNTPLAPESPAPPRCRPPRKAGPPRRARSRKRRDWIQ